MNLQSHIFLTLILVALLFFHETIFQIALGILTNTIVWLFLPYIVFSFSRRLWIDRKAIGTWLAYALAEPIVGVFEMLA